MLTFKSTSYNYKIIKSFAQNEFTPQPLLRDDNGSINIQCVSPIHGRSFIVNKNSDDKLVISKGNGLSYSTHNSINTESFGKYTWGLLQKDDAIRDFIIGQEIQSLGIKTNQMEYVLEIDKEIEINSTGEIIKPHLLQYNVESPYRISDFGFISKDTIIQEVKKWETLNEKSFKESYLIAAYVLIKNLRIMHDNNVLHNAIHVQNYTWALELLDFESSRSNNFPYSNAEYEKHVPMLVAGEIIQTYEVINYISWCLGEVINYGKIDNLFKQYGFDLQKFKLF